MSTGEWVVVIIGGIMLFDAVLFLLMWMGRGEKHARQ